MSSDCFCVKKVNLTKIAKGSLKANLVVQNSIKPKFKSHGNLKINNGLFVGSSAQISSIFDFNAKENVIFNPNKFVSIDNSKINAHVILSGVLHSRIASEATLNTNYVDKIGGSYTQLNNFTNFTPLEKLYPIQDINIASGSNLILNKDLSRVNLYQSIDEGIFTGNYTKNFKNSSRISDELSSYITPSSIFTKGDFNYKFEVTAPTKSIGDNFLFIRASAPLKSHTSNLPPIYTLSNLRLEDPSGNLIVKYKDIIIKGDADYGDENYKNFVTYISEPEVNHAKAYEWKNHYPLFGIASGYTLNIDINVSCADDPFSEGFNFGFEDTCHPKFITNSASGNDYLALDGSPISTQNQEPYLGLNLTDNLRISAIEIISSGASVGIKKEHYLNMYAEVPPIGLRSSRSILPSKVLKYNYNTTIYPSDENSLWKAYDNVSYNNEDDNILHAILSDQDTSKYIELVSTTSIADSGKLKLKFSHEAPVLTFQLADGAFAFGSDLTGFDSAIGRNASETDSFFIVDEIELKVIAKKAVGSRDYVLDVVGYSDDKLLNITPKIGGFLQNASGVGTYPTSSGFNSIDDLGISSEAISDKFQYFESSSSNNAGGDHYLLPSSPVVNSTSFKEYTIPLKVYSDSVNIGKSLDYSMSSYFENLYLDIYPLPSGAQIAYIYLSFTYKPSNALTLNVVGHADKDLHKANINIYPSPRKQNDRILNSVLQNADLSLIEDIPHAYKTPTTIKTNYSRRWRGVDGNIVNGPFYPLSFDFSFYNPELERPFLDGFYDFTNIVDNFILSNRIGDKTSSVSGTFNSNLSSSIIDNIGLRFNSNKLFINQKRNYKTIDWTTSGHELEGKILDSFDKAVRVSGVHGNINFGSGIPVSSGFSAYIRFAPDVTISGSSYNLWDSGVLLSKWDSGKNLEFAIGFSGGYLCGIAQDKLNNIIHIYDTQDYTTYQYPLSILLTYNDNLSSGLKLYVDNEIASGAYNSLKASSSSFELIEGNSNIVAGYSSGSGVGINAFITEIGLSSYNESGCNIVEANNYKPAQQTTAYSFLNGHRAKFWNAGESYIHDTYKLHDYVDENINNWHLGDYSLCEFNHEFDRFTKRIGSDFLSYHLRHHGSGYTQITNIALPTDSINISGLAYHTQIENDMLRLNLGTIPDGDSQRLYSPLPRICKTLPRDYDFTERAFVVETVIQNEIDNSVIWSDGNVGPKLIVSLYTTSKDPTSYDAINLGLINRHTHYLNDQSGCWQKISSTFDYNDWVDTSEPWAVFNQDLAKSEFEHKYYSTDLKNMFLQYDIAYPSGQSFNSHIKLHTINVKLENALASGDVVSSSGFTLYASGAPVRLGYLDLFVNPSETLISSGLLLYSSGSPPLSVSNSGLGLATFGYDIALAGYPSGSLSLFMASGANSITFTDNPVINFVTNGKLAQDETQSLPIYIYNNEILPQYSGSLSLYTKVDGVNIFDKNNDVTFYVHGSTRLRNRENDSMPLYIDVALPDPQSIENLNFFVYGSPLISSTNNSLNLTTINYLPTLAGADGKLQYINWYNNNVGTGILVAENGYSYLESNDEIRGVDLICFGNCNSNTPQPCEDPVISIHGENFGGDCIDGGIFRAKRLYTNLATSGFKTDVGYSGHFYGIRKYEGLIPNAPYEIKIVGESASDDRKELPKTLEWEYGSNNEVNFSGIKLVADGISGASGAIISISDSGRNIGDQYGKAVKVKGDYMLVGAPYHNVYDEFNYDLGNAGTVFVYKRNAAPSGFDWSSQDDKSGWSFVTELSLPVGLQRDYYTTEISQFQNEDNEDLPFSAIKKLWHVGQEGRELGYSLDLSNSGEYPTIVVGAPSCKWTRTFDDPPTSGVNVAIFIFSRPFRPEYTINGKPPVTYTFRNILSTITNNNLLYKYFCNPSVELIPKIIVCEPILDTINDPQNITDPEAEGFVYKFNINNHGAFDTNLTPGWQSKDDQIFEQLKEIFNGSTSGVYKYDASKPNNNIPAIVGCYIDDSFSMRRNVVGNAVNRFIDWYKSYSLNSGVVDIYGNPRSGSTLIHYDKNGEQWIQEAQNILDLTLDTGRLISSNDFELFANNLGTFRSDISAFNIPPASGGAVFIFKEEINDGNLEWNVIQEINSPTSLNNIAPDRFGHSVAISDNAEIIVIGSPYINQALQVYQLDNTVYPQDYVGQWLNKVGPADNTFGYLRDKYRRYQDISASQGNIVANNILYNELNASGKLQLRRDENIQHYQLIKTYSYSDIPLKGAWTWLYSKFAPTPRLGYSVAVNEDGSIFAAGSPTDSVLDDNFDLWWRPSDVYSHYWYSNVNAGAVRVFESRKYYPHNDKVVEFTRFGNKHRSLNYDSSPALFDHMGQIYASAGKSFERLPEDEVDIPNDAGLVFIITPEVDALSEEILDNIQDWLGLGDRHLVIVTDDPVYEENGAYATTNNIVNNLLSRLNSRMEVIAARNPYEALISSNRLDNNSYSEYDANIIPSFVPSNTTSSYIYPLNLWASGVADIKLHYEGLYDIYNCQEKNDILDIPELDKVPSYQDINDKCNMPLKHLGDIRSQWNEVCFDKAGGIIVYPKNLALYFGTIIPANYGCDEPYYDSVTKNYEPIPILSASEYVLQTNFYPATPDRIKKETYIADYISETRTDFATNSFNDAAFYWSAESNNYNSFTANLQPTSSPSVFNSGESIFNNTISILRANSNTEIAGKNEPVDISDYIIIAKESYANTTSEVYLISTTETESSAWLESGFGDENILFYANILNKVGSNVLKLGGVAQLGGWTNRSSFNAGRIDSALLQLLEFVLPYTANISENVEDILPFIDTNDFDAVWIANTDQLIDNVNLQNLKSWLSKGNRKLYISYGRTDSSEGYNLDTLNAAQYLCEALNLNIKPLFLNNKEKYADSTDFRNASTEFRVINKPVLPTSFVTFGEMTENDFDILNISNNIDTLYLYSNPIDIRNGGTALISTSDDQNKIIDNNIINYGVPYLKTGIAKINFPVIGGSGYRLFIDTVSASIKENIKIEYQVSNCSTLYGSNSSGTLTDIKDIKHSPGSNDHNSEITLFKDFIGLSQIQERDKIKYLTDEVRFQTDGSINREAFNIFIPTGVDNISIYFNANKVNFPVETYEGQLPATTRIIGVSGALVPAEVSTKFRPVFGSRDVIVPGTPARTETLSQNREISTSSLKYCPSTECLDIFTARNSGSVIADGPVVVAQELYHQRPFDAGVNKSRITVITDASMIQGKRIVDQDGKIQSNIISFLHSLYPDTIFPDVNQGRQFNIITKLTSQEIGSPNKFFNSISNSGLITRFNGVSVPTSGRPMSDFSDTIDPATLDINGNPKAVLPILIGDPAKKWLQLRELTPPPSDPEAVKRSIINTFESQQYAYGGTAKFSGIIDGVMYADAYYGQMPQILSDKGYDYLDFDKLPSGYPGDLFGYSIALRDNKLLIGAPFAAFNSETPVAWTNVANNTPRYEQASGTVLGYGGGAGAVYLFERGDRILSDYGVETQSKSWNLTRKFRPNSINVGQDLCLNNVDETEISNSGWILGNNNYKIADLRDNSFTTDQFGFVVDLYSDMIAIGAPGHDFGNYEDMAYERGGEASGMFIYKEFNNAFDIPKRTIYDLGESGIRNIFVNSGIPSVLNNGAVYTYENQVKDWDAKTKHWIFKQKLVSKGYNDRLQKSYFGPFEIPASGSENDYFGKSLSIYQQNRTDSNYILAIGSPHHKCATSGNHSSFASGIDAGAIYTFDGILRRPETSTANSGTFIDAKVYGDSGINRSNINDSFVSLKVINNNIFNSLYEATGLVYSNNDGEIFLEASGQDLSERGFITHRPFIKEITGKYLFGTPMEKYLRLYTEGHGVKINESMNLFNAADNSAIVYNNLGLYTSAILGFASGVPSGLTLFSNAPDPTVISESGLTIYVSGAPIINNSFDLRIRGK